VAAVAIVSVLTVPFLWTDDLFASEFWGKNFIGEALGLDAGNHGPLYVLYQLTEAVVGRWDLHTWGRFTLLWRALILIVTSALVLISRRGRVETCVAVLLLAHFVSYFQVWEHHFSGAVVAGLLLSVGLHREGRRQACTIALLATAAMALPSPYVVLPADPSTWTSMQRLVPPAFKSIPLVLAYALGMRVISSGITRAHGA
jgi:hypothetical protein